MNKIACPTNEIDGMVCIEAFSCCDNRGSLVKDYSRDNVALFKLMECLDEVYYVTSYKGVLRGVHFQYPEPQTRLIRCVMGSVYGVVVDLRKQSRSFMRWRGMELTGLRYNELLVPKGCAFGALSLEDNILSCKCSGKFFAEYSTGIRWDDTSLGIDWPLTKIGGAEQLIISEKDKNLPCVTDFLEKYNLG